MKIKNIPKAILYFYWRWIAAGQLDKLWTSQNYQELIVFCDTMLNKNETDYLAFYYRGLAKEMLNLLNESIEDFKKSESLLSANRKKSLVKDYFTRIPIQISRVYRKLQDKDKTFDYADRAVHADNLEIDGLKWRATIKEDFGDYLGASEDLNEALRRRPKNKSLIKLRDRLTYIIIENRKETASR